MRFENIERINIPTYLVICISPLLHVDDKFEPFYVSRTFIKYTETTQYIPDQILAQYRILSNWSRNGAHLPPPLPHILWAESFFCRDWRRFTVPICLDCKAVRPNAHFGQKVTFFRNIFALF